MRRDAPGWRARRALDVQREKRRGDRAGAASRVWFTLSHGILNEITTRGSIRRAHAILGLMGTDGAGIAPKRSGRPVRKCRCWRTGVPASTRNTACDGDGTRSQGRAHRSIGGRRPCSACASWPGEPMADYRVYVLLAPHLNNHGAGNTAWVREYKGVPMLWLNVTGTHSHLLFRAVAERSVGLSGIGRLAATPCQWRIMRLRGARENGQRGDDREIGLAGVCRHVPSRGASAPLPRRPASHALKQRDDRV